MAGSLRRRGENSWELRVYAGYDRETGRKEYVTRTVRCGKREAERTLARLVTEVEQGIAPTRVGTVAEACERWFTSAAPNLSPAVSAEYRRLLDRHILPALGQRELRRLRTAELDAWYAKLRKQGGVGGRPLAPNSVQRVHAVVRRALNQALRWGWIAVNPAVSATPPRVVRASLHVPDPTAVASLIKAARKVNPALPLFLRLAAVSGARRGELCALRWRHVDLERGELHVEGAIVEAGGEVILKDTKTHAERRIALDAGTIAALRDYKELLDRVLETAATAVSDEGFVFSHEVDGSRPWRPNYATLAFGRLARSEGLSGMRLHDLRHFAATTMLTSGVDIRTAAGRLGHAQTSTTLDVYSHFMQPADQAAAAVLGSALDDTGREA